MYVSCISWGFSIAKAASEEKIVILMIEACL
jgi:hypothetical protein